MVNNLSGLDRLFHALSDPTRRAMIQQLSRGPVSLSDLAHPLPMSLPAVMQHLRVLERAGLVRSEKVGRVRTCTMQPDALNQVEKWIQACRTEWEHRLDRLGDYLHRLNKRR